MIDQNRKVGVHLTVTPFKQAVCGLREREDE